MKVAARLARMAGLSALFVVAAVVPAQGTPIVTATVTPVGALFHYDYSITFNALDDEIALVSIHVPTGDTILDATLVAPPLYLASYDIGLGFLDFLPVLSFPNSGTVSGFAFNSARGAAPTTFDALTIFGGTLSGQTIGPLGSARAVPEPATGALVAIGLAALRRRVAQGRRQSNR